MTRSKMREHCFKMLFAAEFYPAQEVEQQTRQYFDSPDEDVLLQKVRQRLFTGLRAEKERSFLIERVEACGKA